LYKKLHKDVKNARPFLEKLENATKHFVANLTETVDAHAAETGANFTNDVLPTLRSATDKAFNSFNNRVTPKVQKVVKSAYEWGKNVAQNAEKNVVPGVVEFGQNTASNWMEKVQPVIDQWIKDNEEGDTKVFQAIGKKVGDVAHEVREAIRFEKCNEDICCEMEWT